MKRCIYVVLWVIAVARLAGAGELKPLVKQMELSDGDTVVFLGDSITHQCLYTQYVEDYFYTRFPHLHIRFHNAGVGGDTAGDALVRFDEDVASMKPRYVTVLLGMNDGRYRHFDHEIFATYERDMTQLMDRIASLGATAILMHPTMFDSRAVALNPRKKPDAVRDQYYNGVLAFYGAWLQEQAQARGLGLVNMYSRLNELTMLRRKVDPEFTLIPDAVHPGPAGQAIMAYALLEDMGAGRQVSRIDAVRGPRGWRVTAGGGTVSDVEQLAGGLAFTFQADCLPWVLPEEAAEGYQLIHAGHRLSNERIRVSGLEPGRYELKIDGQTAGTYTHVALASRVELQSNPKTPQYQQALAVAMLNKERNEKAVHPLRDEWRALKAKRRALDRWLEQHPDSDEADAKRAELDEWHRGFQQRVAKLLAEIEQYDRKIYAANQPKARRYEVVRVAAAAPAAKSTQGAKAPAKQ